MKKSEIIKSWYEKWSNKIDSLCCESFFGYFSRRIEYGDNSGLMLTFSLPINMRYIFNNASKENLDRGDKARASMINPTIVEEMTKIGFSIKRDVKITEVEGGSYAYRGQIVISNEDVDFNMIIAVNKSNILDLELELEKYNAYISFGLNSHGEGIDLEKEEKLFAILRGIGNKSKLSEDIIPSGEESISSMDKSNLTRVYNINRVLRNCLYNSNLAKRNDFSTHVIEKGEIDIKNVGGLLNNMICAPIKETRGKHLGSKWRFLTCHIDENILEAGTLPSDYNNVRIREAVIEVKDDKMEIVTIFEISHNERINFWRETLISQRPYNKTRGNEVGNSSLIKLALKKLEHMQGHEYSGEKAASSLKKSS